MHPIELIGRIVSTKTVAKPMQEESKISILTIGVCPDNFVMPNSLYRTDCWVWRMAIAAQCKSNEGERSSGSAPLYYSAYSATKQLSTKTATIT
jgi:hypothetical protein